MRCLRKHVINTHEPKGRNEVEGQAWVKHYAESQGTENEANERTKKEGAEYQGREQGRDGDQEQMGGWADFHKYIVARCPGSYCSSKCWHCRGPSASERPRGPCDKDSPIFLPVVTLQWWAYLHGGSRGQVRLLHSITQQLANCSHCLVFAVSCFLAQLYPGSLIIHPAVFFNLQKTQKLLQGLYKEKGITENLGWVSLEKARYWWNWAYGSFLHTEWNQPFEPLAQRTVTEAQGGAWWTCKEGFPLTELMVTGHQVLPTHFSGSLFIKERLSTASESLPK